MTTQLEFLQAPKVLGGADQGSGRWLNLKVNHPDSSSGLAYEVAFSVQSAEEQAGQDQGVWEQLQDYSAAEVKVSWQPTIPWLLQFEGSLLGDGYHPPGNGENLTRARAALSSDVDLGAHTKIGAELAHRWWDQEGERELTGHIDYSSGTTAGGLKAEEALGGVNSKSSRVSGHPGRAGEVGWSLKGVLGRGKDLAAPWREGKLGLPWLRPLDWLGTELAYSRAASEWPPERNLMS